MSVLFLVHAVAAGVLIAALVELEAPLAVKFLLVAFWLPLALLLVLLQEQREGLRRLYIPLRLSSVSTETRRLDPNDEQKATDILSADLETESKSLEIERLLSGGSLTHVMRSLTYVAVAAVVAATAIAI
jgi:hypothetical protein